MKIKENTKEQQDQEIDMELLHKLMEDVAEKGIHGPKHEEAMKYPLVASEEVLRHFQKNTPKAENTPSK